MGLNGIRSGRENYKTVDIFIDPYVNSYKMKRKRTFFIYPKQCSVGDK